MSWTYEWWNVGKRMVKRNEKGRFVKGHRHLPKQWIDNNRKARIGMKFTKERKQHINEALKGKKKSKVHCINIGKAIKGNHNLGKYPRTDEMSKNMSKAAIIRNKTRKRDSKGRYI